MNKRKRLDEERPSPDEIRDLCRSIQARWTDHERARRSSDKPHPWEVPRFEGDVSEHDSHPPGF